MNLIINLSTKNRLCEPILYKNNYVLDTIELKFNKLDGKEISADILLKNTQLNNLFFVECKDGGLELDQANRYESMTKEDIANAKIATLNGDVNHEIAYIGTETKKDKLISDIEKNSFNFPILVDKGSKIALEYNKFNCELLEKIFTNNGGVDVQNFSIFQYPFGKDDSDAHILSRLVPALLKYMAIGEEFDPEDLLRETHPLFEYVDRPSTKELVGKIARIIDKLSKNELNGFFMVASNKRFKLKNRGEIGFKNKLIKCIENADKKAESSLYYQKNLFDF